MSATCDSTRGASGWCAAPAGTAVFRHRGPVDAASLRQLRPLRPLRRPRALPSPSHARVAYCQVIAEAALGLPLLPGESEHNQLVRIATLLGPPPPHLIRAASRACMYELQPEGRRNGTASHGVGAHYQLR